MFVKKKVKSFIVPYFIFSIISYLIWIAHRIYAGNIMNFSYFYGKGGNIFKPLVGIFYGNGINGWLPNVALWFLVCLFITEIIFYLFAYKFKKNYQLLIVVIIFGMIGYLDSRYMPIRLPWGVDVALNAIVFFGVGYLIKQKDLVNRIFERKWIVLLIFLLSGLLSFGFNHLNGMIDMNSNQYNNIIYFYLSAFGGIVFYLIIAKIIGSNLILERLGKISLDIMAIHTLIFIVLNDIRWTFYKLAYNTVPTESNILMPVVYSITAIVCIIFIRKIIDSVKEYKDKSRYE